MIKRVLLVVLVLCVLVAGCVTQEPVMKDGKAYGVTKGTFRGRWWSYYERGVSYQSGEFYEEARADFAKAIELRGRDAWQARTYGLHFVEYFPNRELGVASYHLGQLEEAEQSLRTSLSQIDTDRAHYYLDLVTRAKIAQGTLTDETEPVLDTSVEEKVIITSRELPIEIKATDDIGVSSVQVNGEELPQRGSAEEVVFKDEMVLEEGTHTIEIAASDLADKEVKETKQVEVDLTGPTIGLFAPADPTVTENVETLLEGVCLDKNFVASVALSDRVLAESTDAKRLEFAAGLPLGRGENSFVVAAKDMAGNETRSAVKVFRGRPDSMAARLWMIEQRAPHLLTYAAAGFPEIMLGLDVVAAAEEESLLIKLKSPKPDRPYRHNRTLRVSGDIVAQSNIASLSINGTPIDEIAGAPKESFNRRIPIDEADLQEGSGTKVVKIAAKDVDGNEIEQDFSVDIQPVQLNTRASRMPVAVLAFAGADVEQSTSDLLRVTTEGKLFEAKRFNVLDRTQLQAVLTEQQLAGALADPDQAIQLGKIVNAHAFFVADVFLPDEKGVEIKARLISPETSELLDTLDAFVDDKSDRAKIELGCAKLAAGVLERFPRLSGEVLGVRGGKIMLNWSAEDGVQEGMYLLVVQQEEPWIDEDTGEVLAEGETVEIGRAQIERVTGSNCIAAPVTADGAEGAEFDTGMAAITM